MIIFTTGFDGDMRRAVGEFVGPEIEGQLDDFWGVDEEGEILGAWKFSGRKFLKHLSPNTFYCPPTNFFLLLFRREEVGVEGVGRGRSGPWEDVKGGWWLITVDQIRNSGIWPATLDSLGIIRGLWRCRLRLICWGCHWSGIQRLLDRST